MVRNLFCLFGCHNGQGDGTLQELFAQLLRILLQMLFVLPQIDAEGFGFVALPLHIRQVIAPALLQTGADVLDDVRLFRGAVTQCQVEGRQRVG